MEWAEALEIVVAREKVERYRKLCDETHADHAIWRQKMIVRATGEQKPIANGPPPMPLQYPPIIAQVGGFLDAMGRMVRVGLTGASMMVSEEVFASRMAICGECEHYEVQDKRCRLCGCFLEMKGKLMSESGRCPAGKW